MIILRDMVVLQGLGFDAGGTGRPEKGSSDFFDRQNPARFFTLLRAGRAAAPQNRRNARKRPLGLLKSAQTAKLPPAPPAPAKPRKIFPFFV
jgi:hypothetical protein